MRALLDTNIVIHREASRAVNPDIGVLFRWLDRLGYQKCVHPLSIGEFETHKDPKTKQTLSIKLEAYERIRAPAPLHPTVEAVARKIDTSENDRIDTLLLNEVYCDRVDILVSEDKKIHVKAARLGLAGRVFRIEAFLEKVTSENPELTDYKVLSVRRRRFAEVDVNDPFFDTFRADYAGFDAWYNRKADEECYVCTEATGVTAFLYVKVEDEREPYPDISPTFGRKRRLKIGTFKVVANGHRLGERFLKIVFDNAMRNKVEEVYVTMFDRQPEQRRLIELISRFGFVHHGSKSSATDEELVYTRDMSRVADLQNPRATFPYFSRISRAFLVPIYPKYHTELFPDAILRGEDPQGFKDSIPHRNAISKVYISRSIFRDLKPGDVLIFYRTKTEGKSAYYSSVTTTIGIVEDVILGFETSDDFIAACRKRSVFSDAELLKHWNYNPKSRPFVVNFLYVYTFPNRLNLSELIRLGVIAGPDKVPRGFEQISGDQLNVILKESRTDDRIAVD